MFGISNFRSGPAFEVEIKHARCSICHLDRSKHVVHFELMFDAEIYLKYLVTSVQTGDFF